MSKVDEIISKSLDDVESIISQIRSDNDIAKGMGSNEPAPEDVSENAPEPSNEEGTEEEGTGEEGTEEGTEEGAGEGSGEEGTGEGAGEEGTDTDTDTDDSQGEGNEGEDYEKSLESEMSSNDSVRKALEVSEFLTELVKSISTVIGDQRMDITKSLEASNYQTDMLGKSFEGLAKAQKAVLETQAEVLKSVRSLNSRIDMLEKQPLTRKSVPNSKALEKSFTQSVGANKPTNVNAQGTTLSKSEAVTILTNEYSKGNTTVVNDILALESTGDFNVLSQSAKSLLNLK